MPIYEYKCSKCGEVFEAIQKFSDPPVGRCKFCGGGVERLISSSSFQLKGSGWYLTDYARKSQGSGSSEPAEKSGEKKSEEKKSGEKPADGGGTPAKSDPSSKPTPKE